VDPLRTEEEQLEALKQWWEENGKSTIAAIVLVIAGWSGWQYWDAQTNAHREAGSSALASIEALMAQEELTDIQRASIATLSESLQSEYADTGYAELGALAMASFHSKEGNYAEAETVLKDLLARDDIKTETRLIATLRYGKLQWANGDAESALETLNVADASSFVSLYEELKGDIKLSLGQKDDARTHYQVALAAVVAQPESQVNAQRRGLLEMKIESIATI